MHTCKFVPQVSFSLLLSVLVPTQTAFAQSTSDGTHALGGTVSLAASASTVIDRSYVMSGSAPHNFEFKKRHLKLHEYLDNTKRILPNTVASIAFQDRSYNKGPVYTSPELTVGNYPSGLDVSYQHYEGGLHGDGFGLRFSNDTRKEYAAQRQSLAYETVMEDRKKWLSLREQFLTITIPKNCPHDILQDDYDEIERFIKSLPATGVMINGGVKTEAEIMLEFTGLVADSCTAVDALVSIISSGYTAGNLRTNFALIAGDANVNGVTVVNLGGSVSKLFALPGGKVDNGAWGVLGSVQQEFISLGPVTETSVTQAGVAVAWQDKIATAEHRYDRWQTLFGVEYVLRTVLDRSATCDAFFRYRPCYRGPSVGYVPLEFTVYGGVGPAGYGFVGAKIGFGSSL